MAHDESDEQEASLSLRNIIADLNLSSPSAMSSPARLSARPSLMLSRRASSREQSRSIQDSEASSSQTLPLFSNPNRSIFSSGPPTSSLSVNTAHASMSSPQPPSSPHPLSALTTPNLNTRRLHQPSNIPTPSRKARFSKVEKDVDDPSGSMEESLGRRGEVTTSTAVSSLFSAPESAVSRQASYVQQHSDSSYVRSQSSEATAALPNHLYNRGLLSGRHSDITVHAFSTKYALHRLLLDRAPFFCSALSEPWFESSAKEITLHPEDVDSNITQTAFELALKRIYGCHSLEEEDKEPISLLATGCWLEMADLIEASINAILKQMTPAKLATYIRFVTSNYYGKHGDRILTAAKAMLCREGYEMLLRYFDGIAGDIIREIIGSDGFYAPGEWERWVLARRILNRRLKQKAIETGIMNLDGKLVKLRPASLSFTALRFDAVYRNTAGVAPVGASADIDLWLGLYTHPDIAPLLVLLDEGIHYVHMSFEQLQKIREQRDILGVPLMPEKVISNALWMSMELRQRILNADDSDLNVGLSQEVNFAEEADEEARRGTKASELSQKAVGKKPLIEDEGESDDEEMESDSWDGNAKPRKFWIPLSDATYPMGSSTEATTSSDRPSSRGRHTSRISSSLDPQDMQWAADFASTAQDRSETPTTPTVANGPSPEVHYSHFPPFRFAAEFPPAKSLKADKRVYSNTVWYAGSLWNVYVQKKESPKSTQLGVYLHRERQSDRYDEITSNMAHGNATEIEREFLRRQAVRRHAPDPRAFGVDDTGSSDTTLVPRLAQDLDTISGLLRPQGGITKASEASLALGSLSDRRFNTADAFDDDEADAGEVDTKQYKVATMPRYLDSRPTIKTYFKIYTPSKGGRMLSVYESAPDKFNFSQSWGWKSSNLVVDDGAGTVEEGERTREPRLRFMVVIGNV